MIARARLIDALTGDVALDSPRRTWAQAPSPELAVVQNVLRTPLGTAGRDPTFGVAIPDNAAPNAAAVCRQSVLFALKRWIDSGFLRDVQVDVEVASSEYGAELRFRVSFKGRSTARTQTYRSET